MKRNLLTAVLSVALAAVAMPAPAHEGTPLAMLQKIESQLNLNTSQQQQFDAVLAQSKAARATARASFVQVRSALQTELAKSEPDFAAVAALGDGVRQQNEALRKQTRDAWLALYATFTPEQKALTRDTIQAGLDRMAARRSMRQAPPQSPTE
jgi:Spy/CpxP family protein refolding chaperone